MSHGYKAVLGLHRIVEKFSVYADLSTMIEALGFMQIPYH